MKHYNRSKKDKQKIIFLSFQNILLVFRRIRTCMKKQNINIFLRISESFFAILEWLKW
jgi:hypothetical protein